MSRLEKFLPHILAITLPTINFISNNGFDSLTIIDPNKLPRWFLVYFFLIGVWYLNQFSLKQKLVYSKAPIIPIILVIDTLYILVFSSINLYLLPSEISLGSFLSPFALFLRLFLASFLFAAIQLVFIKQQEQETLKLENLALQSKNLKAQLDTFKQQINPHFLFNSLNTLIDLIEEDHEQAIDFVRHFSNLYRVVLQSSKKDLIRVEEEISLLDSYWKLLQMRFRSSITLGIHIEEAVMNCLIPPLSLQLLLENAVKHNEFSKDKPLNISISGINRQITIVNSTSPKKYQESSEGLGLKNLSLRYEFILKKIPEFQQENGYFKVSLPLKE